MSKTVYVGMSGGVDSSVAAALLKQQGYGVVGVYMKNWSQDLPGHHCPWKEDYQDAKRVAVQLGIEFKMYDFEEEYRHIVVDYMLDEYKAGRTPNPDIMCNQEIKFKLFLNTALKDGADMIATGHYARIMRHEPEDMSQEKNHAPYAIPHTSAALYVAKNKEKDQSYFLYRVSQEALSRSLMPIGDFKTKAEVRAAAKKLGLATADKQDSQGICFVGSVGIKDFLKTYLYKDVPRVASGVIVNQGGQEVGEHDGAIFYTIGQRHGLNIGGGLPYYVTGKDMKKNIVYVTTDLDDKKLWHDEIRLTNAHWISGEPDYSKTYDVRTRYRAPLIKAKLSRLQGHPLQASEVDTLQVKLSEPVRAVTAGQSAVFYEDERVLGGGIIC